MSKLNLILVILLFALTLCLSACGEATESSASPSQSHTEHSAYQAEGTSSTVETIAGRGNGDVSEASAAKTNGQAAKTVNEKKDAQTGDKGVSAQASANEEGVNEKNAAPVSGRGPSAQSGADETKPQENRRAEAEVKPNSDENHQNTESGVAYLSATEPDSRNEERDNVEVNFNDL